MQQKNPENPANTGGKEKLPGYPEVHDPAGTPRPLPEGFPGKPAEVYASDKKSKAQAAPQPKRDQPRDNPDVNQPKRDREGDIERSMKPGHDKGDRQHSSGNRPDRTDRGSAPRKD